MGKEANTAHGIKYAKCLAQCLAHQKLMAMTPCGIMGYIMNMQALQVIFAEPPGAPSFKYLWVP